MVVIVSCRDDLNYLKWFLGFYNIRYSLTPHNSCKGVSDEEWMVSFDQDIPDLKSDLKPTAKVYQLAD